MTGYAPPGHGESPLSHVGDAITSRTGVLGMGSPFVPITVTFSGNVLAGDIRMHAGVVLVAGSGMMA
jgi:hypothetical protein